MDLLSDLNNNKRKEKSYSLRPRSFNKKHINNENNDFIIQNIYKPKNKIKKNKPKQKPPPLSKYRRKTANARERHRMKEINDAFETLRKAIPIVHFVNENVSNEKMTKITTLKLAMKYISALDNTLKESLDSDGDADSLTSDYTWSTTPDLPFTSLTSYSIYSDHEQSLNSEYLFSDSSTTDNLSDFPLDYNEYNNDFSCDFSSNNDEEVSSFLFDTDFS